MNVLERFAAGEVEAFEPLFRQHQREVYGWIVRIVRDPGTAEDLTLEAFWRLYQRRDRLDPGANCAAWLRRVATNLAIDHLRRFKPMVLLAAEPAGPNQTDSVELQEGRAAIRNAVNGLSPKLRAVVQLVLIENEPYAAVAESLGISLSAVKLRVFRATRILRKKLKEAGVWP
jgi:RNA polymerase sigma-70 factor (ECF subfamily)